MTKGKYKAEYLKSECPNCGREVVVTKRQRNRQCQRCYNATHKFRVYWKEGGEKGGMEDNKES